MYRRTALALAVASLALAGCSALSPTGAPLLTVENHDDAEYRLTVYVLPDVEEAADLGFRATDGAGTRRSVGTAALRANASFRNVTLDAENAEVRRLTIRAARVASPAATATAGARTSAVINVWEPGDATVYVIETADANRSVVGVHAVICGARDQEHGITVAEGAITGRSATCP